jgi:hypothetical protein
LLRCLAQAYSARLDTPVCNLGFQKQQAAQWRRRTRPGVRGDRYCESVHHPDVVTNRHQLTVELDRHITLQPDDGQDFFPPCFGLLLAIAVTCGGVQRQQQTHVFRPPLDRIEQIARQRVSGDTHAPQDEGQGQCQAQRNGWPSLKKPSCWASLADGVRTHGQGQLW